MKKGPSQPLQEAFGKLGFPRNLLVASLSSASAEALAGRIERPTHILTSEQELDKALQPAVLGKLAEALFNEGITLRELRRELSLGYVILAVAVPEREQAEQLAASLYKMEARTIRYFDDYEIVEIAPAVRP
ncbi:MAG: hypothetical protein AB7S38_19480 [Vulcanimicrobiota bacterium]